MFAKIGKFVLNSLVALGSLACILTWLNLRPRDFLMGAYMPHLAWLVAGLLLFVVSIGMSAYSIFFCKPSELMIISKIRADCDEEVGRIKGEASTRIRQAEEAQRRCEQANNRAIEKAKKSDELLVECEEERRGIKQQLDIFSPLQIEAFQLSKDLKKFYDSLPPVPHVDPTTSKGDTPDLKIRNHMIKFNNLLSSYQLKVQSGYEADFAPRVKTLMHNFGKVGLHDPFLPQFTETIMTGDDITNLQKIIIRLAHKIDGLDFRGGTA